MRCSVKTKIGEERNGMAEALPRCCPPPILKSALTLHCRGNSKHDDGCFLWLYLRRTWLPPIHIVSFKHLMRHMSGSGGASSNLWIFLGKFQFFFLNIFCHLPSVCIRIFVPLPALYQYCKVTHVFTFFSCAWTLSPSVVFLNIIRVDSQEIRCPTFFETLNFFFACWHVVK